MWDERNGAALHPRLTQACLPPVRIAAAPLCGRGSDGGGCRDVAGGGVSIATTTMYHLYHKREK